NLQRFRSRSVSTFQSPIEKTGRYNVKGHFRLFRTRRSMSALDVVIAALGLTLSALFVMLGAPTASYGQDTGYISGTVADKSGAAIVGAEVVLTNTAGNLTRTTMTNSDGAYVIAGLPGGAYNLSVTSKGFQKYTAQNVKLDVAE